MQLHAAAKRLVTPVTKIESCGGGVIGEFVIHGTPRMATLRVGAYARADGCCQRKIERLPVAMATMAENASVTLLEEIAAPAGSGPKLTDAKIVVSGGRGLGRVDHWHYIEETAAVLGAAAINTDVQADIFTRASYGVAGNYKEVLPGFIERVRQLRAAS